MNADVGRHFGAHQPSVVCYIVMEMPAVLSSKHRETTRQDRDVFRSGKTSSQVLEPIMVAEHVPMGSHSQQQQNFKLACMYHRIYESFSAAVNSPFPTACDVVSCRPSGGATVCFQAKHHFRIHLEGVERDRPLVSRSIGALSLVWGAWLRQS